MFDEEAKEEWQHDLTSWKNRRKSSSSVKYRGDINDDEPSLTTTNQNKSKSLKNRKWNKFRSVDDGGGEEEDEDDDFYKNGDKVNHSPSHHQVFPDNNPSFSSSPSPSSSSSSSSWRPKNNQPGDIGKKQNGFEAVVNNHSSDEFTDSRKNYLEKTIKISQRPNNSKGFGFEITGGRENQRPISVEKVLRGSSADICNLKAGDVILNLNGVDLTRHYKDSVKQVINAAVERGTVELKIKRSKADDLDDAITDEEDFEVRRPVPAMRWSDSQSSHRSTPPLPPQPDHNTENFAECTPPLPGVPPPPVNWSTFPDSKLQRSDEDTPTGVNTFGRSKITEFFADLSEPLSKATSDFESSSHSASGTKTPPSPNSFNCAASVSSQSSYKTSSEADQTKENLAIQKYKFLGLEPENSEELKVIKGDKMAIQSQRSKLKHCESTFPATVSDDSNYKYSSSYSRTYNNDTTAKDQMLRKEPKIADSVSSSQSRSNDKSVLITADKSYFISCADKNSGYTSSKLPLKSVGKHQSEIEKTGKVARRIDKIALSFDFKPTNFDSEVSRTVDRRSKKFGSEFVVSTPKRGEFDAPSKKIEYIGKSETARNAAAEWKKRDKEMRDREEMEKKDDKYNKDCTTPSRINSFPVNNKNSSTVTNSSVKSYASDNNNDHGEKFNYTYFASNKTSSDADTPESIDSIQSKFTALSSIPVNSSVDSAFSSSASNCSKSFEGFGLKKSQYKQIKLKLDDPQPTSLSTSFNNSAQSKFDIAIQESSIKNEIEKNVLLDEQKRGIYGKSLANNQDKVVFSFKTPATYNKPDVPKSLTESQEEAIQNEIERNVASDSYTGQSWSEPVASFGQEPTHYYRGTRAIMASSGESISLRDSLREEELKLKELKEQQEIERIKLERVKEEKRVEELKIMRLKEEEEVQRMKEHRLKEESEIKKLEMKRIKSTEDIYKMDKDDDLPNQKSIVHDTVSKTGDPEIGIKTSYSVPKPFYPSGKKDEGNEGNPYAKLSRNILLEADLSYDKTTVKSVLLNKPTFFNDKKPPDTERDGKNGQSFSNANFSNTITVSQGFGPAVALPSSQGPAAAPASPTTHNRVPSYSDYANNPQKNPSYFGPTFKRISDTSDTTVVAVRHGRSHSISETVGGGQQDGYGSNISYLLYGEDPKSSYDSHPPAKKSEGINNSNNNKSTGFQPYIPNTINNNVNNNNNIQTTSHQLYDAYRKNFTIKPSTNTDEDRYKNLPKHWVIEEAERMRRAEKEGIQRPSVFNANRHGGYGEPGPGLASFRERSKSGTFQPDTRRIENERAPSHLYQPQRSNHSRRLSSSSSYAFDNTHPTQFTYASFAQPPQHHHSKSSSMPKDQEEKPLTLSRESPSATDRLFPGRHSSSGSISSPTAAKNSAANPQTSNYNCNKGGYNNTRAYSPQSAIDSLFTYNNPHNYPSEANYKEQPRTTSQPYNKRISSSTMNLAHGSWDHSPTNLALGSSLYGSKPALHGYTNSRGNYGSDYSRSQSNMNNNSNNDNMYVHNRKHHISSSVGNWPNYNRSPAQFHPGMTNH